jgi:hypothetical protein
MSNWTGPIRSLDEDSVRDLAKALGDGRVSGARLRRTDAKTALGAVVPLLTDADPNVRIGACCLVQQNAGLLAHASTATTLTTLREALRSASEDWTVNDYRYESQIDEIDVVCVAEKARDALAALSASLNGFGSWVSNDVGTSERSIP